MDRNEKQTKDLLDQNAMLKVELETMSKKFFQAEIDHKINEATLRSKIQELRNQIAQLHREKIELENKFNVFGAQFRPNLSGFSGLSGVIMQAKARNGNVGYYASKSKKWKCRQQ